MTKDEKLRAMIKRDVESGFLYEINKQLMGQPNYASRLKAHPDFWPAVVNELVEKQLPYYQTVSEAGVDKAYDFFMSEAGAEWCLMAAKFVNSINSWAPAFVEDVVERLQNLN